MDRTQVAQKLTSTTLPRNSASWCGAPLASKKLTSGAAARKVGISVESGIEWPSSRNTNATAISKANVPSGKPKRTWRA
jgi:hypothetical protein